MSTTVRFLLIFALIALAPVGMLKLVGHEIEGHPGSAPYWAMGSLTVSNLALVTWLLMSLRDRRRKGEPT